MSQIYKSLLSGPVPPSVPTSFVTDVNSPAIPAANVLNEIGGSVTTNNVHGIQTDGSSGSNTLTVQLTNRLTGSVTTVGAVTSPIITFPLGGVAGTYTIQVQVAGYENTGPSSTSYFEFICAATTGAAARIVSAGDSDEICLEDAALNPSDILITASGNSVVISALGVVGLTIDWTAVGTYTLAT